MDPFAFWSSPKRFWPWTPPADGVVFLAAAMYRIGRARYGDEWNNREAALTTLLPFNPLPERWVDARAEQMAVARGVLQVFPEGVFVKPLDPWADFTMPVLPPEGVNQAPLTPDRWNVARQRIEEIRALHTSAEIRWRDITEATFAFLKVGVLETKLRPDIGGPYRDAPQALWNTDLIRVRQRFWNCQVDLSSPFQQSFAERPDEPAPQAQHDFHLIFVTTATLDAVLSKIRTALDAPTADPLPDPELLPPSDAPAAAVSPTPVVDTSKRPPKPAHISREARAIMAYLPHDGHWREITNGMLWFVRGEGRAGAS